MSFRVRRSNDRFRGNAGRVLIVEDEYLIRLLLEDMLDDLGYGVAGVAYSVPRHGQTATAQIDLAILDVNLDGEEVYPVAEILKGRGLPFFFVTGYGAQACRSITGACRPCRSRSSGGPENDAGEADWAVSLAVEPIRQLAS